VILGLENIKKWSTLVTLRSLSSKPTELLRLALVRAHLAELIAIENKHINSNSFFLSGLLSVLDALLDTPLKTIIQSMPLDPEISQGLLFHEGEIGETLSLITQYENNQCTDNPAISKHYLTACQWADKVMTSL